MGLWRRLVHLGFNLLYHQLAWSYDRVSWAVSKGEWQQWQRAVMPYLRGSRILDLGCGTGNLLLALAATGHRPWGLDASSRMLALAARKARGWPIQLGQGRAQAMPITSNSFDSITITFPADFIADPRTLSELWRVVAPGGRIIVADGGQLLGADLLSRALNGLFRITSRPATSRGVQDALAEVGFQVTWEKKRYPASTILLLIAEKSEQTITKETCFLTTGSAKSTQIKRFPGVADAD